jgi:hypothetical protein
LKVFDVLPAIAVNDAARLTAHLEFGWEVHLNGRLIASVRSKFDILENLPPFTSLSLAVRTPIEMHRMFLVPGVLIATHEV